MMALGKTCVTKKLLFLLCVGSVLSLLVLKTVFLSTFQQTSQWHLPSRQSTISGVARSVQSSSTESACQNSHRHIDQLSADDKKMLFHQVIVNDKYKFMYCAVPKVACSNWKRIIRVLNGEWDSINSGKLEHYEGFMHLSNYTTEEIEYRLKHYYKFMFVRYPISRLLSAYKDKFGRQKSTFQDRYAAKIVRKYRPGWPIPTNVSDIHITFNEFVKFVLDTPIRRMDQHWRPMTDICQPCLVNYSFIGSFENLYNDAQEVFKDLGVQDIVSFPPRQSFYNGTSSNVIQDYFSKLPDDDYRRLVTRYARDFTSFAYPFPDVLDGS
ncbi:carbohydrate sulfotransferase 14-like [Glandiceps talaboti]